eukprot:821951-Pleurochrysis_carterae.AAC.1
MCPQRSDWSPSNFEHSGDFAHQNSSTSSTYSSGRQERMSIGMAARGAATQRAWRVPTERLAH